MTDLLSPDFLLENQLKRLEQNNAAPVGERNYDVPIVNAITKVALYYCDSKNDILTRQMKEQLKLAAENLKDFPAPDKNNVCRQLNEKMPREWPNWWMHLSLSRKERRAASIRSMFYQASDNTLSIPDISPTAKTALIPMNASTHPKNH